MTEGYSWIAIPEVTTKMKEWGADVVEEIERISTDPNVVNVKNYGVVGDGVNDDTIGLQEALNESGLIFIPLGTYKLTSALTVKSGSIIIGAGNADRTFGVPLGTEPRTYLFQATADTDVFSIGENIRDVQIHNMCIGANSAPVYPTGATSGKDGIAFLGNASNSTYRIKLSNLTFYDLDRAISVIDSGSSPYNWQCDNVQVDHCTFFNNNKGVYFYTINADYWIFNTCFFGLSTGQVGVHADQAGYFTMTNCAAGGWVQNTNHFLKVTGPFDIINMIACQGETLASYLTVDATGASELYNHIILNGCIVESEIYLLKKCHYVSMASRYTQGVFCVGDDIIVDSYSDWFSSGGYYSFGAGSYLNNVLATTNSIGGTPGNVLMGVREILGTAAPAAGTYKAGDRIYNSAPSASNPAGWVCTQSGTFGTATDSTGDTNGSTGVITGMADTSDFSAGDWVTVSNGFATTGPFRILTIDSATQITVEATSDSAETDVTVAHSDPVFKAMANLAA